MQQKEIHNLNKGLQKTVAQLNKKRIQASDSMQTRLFDRHSEVSKVTASKSKQENSSNPHSQPNQVSEQDSGREAEEFFDVEAAMKRRNEEREF